jgi:CelD/BcsL family acetyltransferase involved in cellulose biosynthesis
MSALLAKARDVQRSRSLQSHRLASLFSSPLWIEALAETYGFDILASVRADKSEPDAAILFSPIRDFCCSRVVVLPFSDYCDPLVDDEATWNDLVEPILLLNCPVRLRCLGNSLPGNDARFSLYKRAKWHSIDLTRSEDDLWAELSAQARQNIRRACANDVVIREGKSAEDVHTFYRMHFHLRKTKYRLLAQPVAFFESLYAKFSSNGDLVTVLIAEQDDTAVAGLFLLQWGRTLYYKFNASCDQSARPNDLLVWRAMLLGHRLGLSTLDFGLSETTQPGLLRFKRKFATEERDICFYQWLPSEDHRTAGREASDVLGHVTSLFTNTLVPDEITKAAGEKLYRYFA